MVTRIKAPESPEVSFKKRMRPTAAQVSKAQEILSGKGTYNNKEIGEAVAKFTLFLDHEFGDN